MLRWHVAIVWPGLNAMNQWQRETLKRAQLAPKAGKVVISAKRGKTWTPCLARENVIKPADDRKGFICFSTNPKTPIVLRLVAERLANFQTNQRVLY